VKTFCLQGAKILLASHFDYEYMLGHKIAFVCVAKGTPQPQITWFKDGIELYAHSYLHVSMAYNKHYVIWDKDINTLLSTNQSTQHHVPKLWFLPTKPNDVTFSNTGTYQPEYTMSHSQILVHTNQAIWSHFLTTGTYLPSKLHSITFPIFSPTNHTTCCHIPLHPPSTLYTVTTPNIFTYQPCYKLSYSQTLAPTIQTVQCHILRHWHLPSRLCGVIFSNTGTYHPDYTVPYSQSGSFPPQIS
jgi:hypothetical protein